MKLSAAVAVAVASCFVTVLTLFRLSLSSMTSFGTFVWPLIFVYSILNMFGLLFVKILIQNKAKQEKIKTQ